MNVKKFSAPTSREALQKLREAMGPDAVIVSNRCVNGQVEILALAEEEMADLDKVAAAASDEAADEHEFVQTREKNNAENIELTADELVTENHRFNSVNNSNVNQILHSQAKFSVKKKQNEQARPVSLSASKKTESAPRPLPMEPDMTSARELMSELRSMRGMMEAQLAEISWGNTQRKEPHKAQVLKEMLSTGFSPGLSRHLIENMPKSSDPEQGLAWIKTILSKNINTISCDSDMLEQGGVFALVGPTGVGKTTTTAKLAARCVMRHGASKLALITTDGYRIGGYEQLRIYGKILGVMVHAVKDEADLEIALSELKNKHTVLIDTVGMSQRDRLVSKQVAMLSVANVSKLLCLNATSTGETLAEVIHSYQGTGLTGCIITKMDEAASLGAVLDAIIREKLTMYYLANGQRVPEDLHVANKTYLVDHAFKLKREQPAFRFHEDELPILMANAPAAVNDRQLREVSLGKL